MVYEIEKRSLFSSKEEFEKCRKYVAKMGKFVNKFTFKSFLFKSPEYLRIRIVKGNPNAIITKKTGDYHSATRQEFNEEVKLRELKSYVKQLESKGFRSCVCVKTTSFAYLFEGLRVDFNSMTYLGNIVEIEALADDKKKVPSLESEINKIMKMLGLKELDANTYQSMIDYMYVKGLKSIGKQKFII